MIEGADPDAIRHCSYDLCLGTEVFVTSEDKKTKRKLEPGEQVEIPPGQFANLMTGETLSIPNDSLGFINARFKWKQRGLINVSGFHVDPGYEGKLLFSVYNAGPSSVVVTQGDRIFTLWLAYLDQETARPYKKDGRTGITSDDVNALQGDVASPQALAKRVDKLEQLASIGKWTTALLVSALIGTLFVLVRNPPEADPAPTAPIVTSTTVPDVVATTEGS